MPCEQFGNGFICSNDVVEHNGFWIEFPPIGCPPMLNKRTYAVINKPPRAFWVAVEDYLKQEKRK